MIIVQVCVGSLQSNYKMDLTSDLSMTSDLGQVNLEPLAGRLLVPDLASGHPGVLRDLDHGQGHAGGGQRRRRS